MQWPIRSEFNKTTTNEEFYVLKLKMENENDGDKQRTIFDEDRDGKQQFE